MIILPYNTYNFSHSDHEGNICSIGWLITIGGTAKHVDPFTLVVQLWGVHEDVPLVEAGVK